MQRAILTLAAASLVFGCLLASSASAGQTGVSGPSSSKRAGADDPGRISLRLRTRLRPWKKSLYLKLVKTRLTPFSVCAITDWQTTQPFDCRAAGAALPPNTSMRLEQTPVARGLVRRDSPGWGMLGTSSTARLGAVLANTVSGNRFGLFRYRVTLRDGSGRLLASSNDVTVNWHR